jgi:hypothetical protein
VNTPHIFTLTQCPPAVYSLLALHSAGIGTATMLGALSKKIADPAQDKNEILQQS